MIKRNILDLERAVNLFNYDEADISVIVRMMANKVALEEAVSVIKKEIKATKTAVKPKEMSDLEEEYNNIPKTSDRANEINRIWNALNLQYSKKVKEIIDPLLDESSITVKIQTITPEELAILLRPAKEKVRVKDQEEFITINRVTSDHLALLSLLTKDETEH